MRFFLLTLSVFCIVNLHLLNGQGTLSDTSRAVTLRDVVVSANKVEETRRTVAQQIQVLYTNQIAGLQAQSTADLMANTGTVYIQKSQLGGGSVTLRGFEASRTLLVIDGVRMNNLIYRTGHLQNIITLDNNSLRKVEILYGSSSTIYGSDALGGVVLLYTKNPVFSSGEEKQALKTNAFSRYGTAANEFTGHIDFNIGGKKIASITSITFSDFGDLKGGKRINPFYGKSFGDRPYYVKRINSRDSIVNNSDPEIQIQSAYRQYDLLQKISYRQNENVTHSINLQYSNSSDIPRYDRLTDPDGSGLKYSEWYYGPQERFLAAYDLNIAKPGSWFNSIHAGINYQNIEESRHTRRFNKNDLSHRIENVNVAGANLDFQKIISRNNIRFGLDAQYNTLKSTANNANIATGIRSPLDTRYPDGDNTMTSAALYFSHTLEINDQFTLTDGLRFEYITLNSTFVDKSFYPFPFENVSQNNPVYSGNIGLIHTPSDGLKLSFLISTGFRAPNVDDLSKVFESAPGQVIVPNPDLKPEQTISYELGVTKIFNNRTSWETTAYFTDFYNAIITDEFIYNGQDSMLYDGTMSQVLANQNKKKAYIYGLSSNIRSSVSHNLFLSFGFNYTYGRINNNGSFSPLDHIPPLMMRLQLSYTKRNFGSEFFINYNSWKKIGDYYLNGEDNEQYATPEGMPAWMTINLRASYKIQKLLTLQAGIDNILDTQYRTFASGINASGRNIFVALRFNY
jgi:hemoglobin/transferrin/lactoferrin receptor protein